MIEPRPAINGRGYITTPTEVGLPDAKQAGLSQRCTVALWLQPRVGVDNPMSLAEVR